MEEEEEEGGGGPRRSPNLFLQVDLMLEEWYKGTTRKVGLNRQKVVEKRIVLEPKMLQAAFEKGMKDGGRVVLAGAAHASCAAATPCELCLEPSQRHADLF